MSEDNAVEFTVTTWNIEFGVRIDDALTQARRRPELARTDIWLLQEMDEPGTARFADGLGFDYVYAHRAHHGQTGRPFGNAVVSRWPLGPSHITELPSSTLIPGTDRLVVGAAVQVPGVGEVAAHSVHAELPFVPPPTRRRHLSSAAAAAPDHLPMVVGGDFNTASRLGRSRLEKTMARYGAKPAVNDDIITLVRFGMGFQLDHVFVRGLTPLAAGSPGITKASDHAPIWVRLRVGEL